MSDAEETFEALASYVELFPPRGVVVDLGCGRGEFLELLEKSGRTALGVDSDSGMAGEAQRKGLKAITADLFAFLSLEADRVVGERPVEQRFMVVLPVLGV